MAGKIFWRGTFAAGQAAACMLWRWGIKMVAWQALSGLSVGCRYSGCRRPEQTQVTVGVPEGDRNVNRISRLKVTWDLHHNLVNLNSTLVTSLSVCYVMLRVCF